jgi:tetratricopeptide (TPR) repeat protein
MLTLIAKRQVTIAALVISMQIGRFGGMEAQELRLEDAGSSRVGVNASNLEKIPLDPARRTALKEAIEKRDYPRAEKILAEEIEKTPKSTELLELIASLFFRDGKYLNTAIALKKAEAIAPLDDRNRFTLALAYIILNHRDWARPELEKLDRSDPRNPLYPYWLGRLDYDAMQYTAAVTNLQKALNLDPTFMKAYDNLGLTYEALGQYEDAIRIYQQAILMNRSQRLPSPWPPLNLGTLLVKLGKLPEAETYLQESLRCEPRFAKAHYQMGLLLEKQKKDEEAIRELHQAAEYDPSYPEPHYLLGKIYQRTGSRTKAEAELEVFQKLKKESPQERPH